MTIGSRTGAANQPQPPLTTAAAGNLWPERPSPFPPPSAGTPLLLPPRKLRIPRRGERVPVRQTARAVIGMSAAIWGIGGLLLLLIYAVARLVPIASESREYTWGIWHWAVLTVNTLLMAYMEGYRGFQKGLAPRVAERARQLARQPSILGVILAPAYCYGILQAPAREMAGRAALIAMIICFIVAVRMLDAPWRGLLDVGVIIGLSWGIVAIGLHGWRAISDPA